MQRVYPKLTAEEFSNFLSFVKTYTEKFVNYAFEAVKEINDERMRATAISCTEMITVDRFGGIKCLYKYLYDWQAEPACKSLLERLAFFAYQLGENQAGDFILFDEPCCKGDNDGYNPYDDVQVQSHFPPPERFPSRGEAEPLGRKESRNQRFYQTVTCYVQVDDQIIVVYCTQAECDALGGHTYSSPLDGC